MKTSASIIEQPTSTPHPMSEGVHHSQLTIHNSQPSPLPPPSSVAPPPLDHLAQLLRRFVILPPWAAETLALWILHTYAFHLRDVTTYLAIESPEKRCGKTTLLTVLSEL